MEKAQQRGVVIFALLFVRYNYFFHIYNDFGCYQIVDENSAEMKLLPERHEFSISTLFLWVLDSKTKVLKTLHSLLWMLLLLGGDLIALPYIYEYVRLGTS